MKQDQLFMLVTILMLCCCSSSMGLIAYPVLFPKKESTGPTGPTGPTGSAVPTGRVCTTKTSSNTCGPEPHCWWSDAHSKCYEICYNTDLKCGNTVPRNDDGTCKYEGKLCVSQNCENKGINKPGITNPC